MERTVTVNQILQQLGGTGLRGALVYTGTRSIAWRDFDARSKQFPHKVEFDRGVSMRVNGKPGETWFIIVSLEASDTYRIRVVIKRRGQEEDIVADVDDIYCDELQRTVESMYDDAIRKFNDGFISL